MVRNLPEICRRSLAVRAVLTLLLGASFGGLFAGRTWASPPPGYHLIWSDEFNGTSLDTSKWNVLTGARRSAINTANALSVGGGDLTITTYTQSGTHYTGMIDTQGLFEQKYGYFEARIKFSDASGEWSAFWLYSPTFGNPVGNAAVAGNEVDIVEHRQVLTYPGLPTVNDASNSMDSTVIWDGYGWANNPPTLPGQIRMWPSSLPLPDLGLSTGYHLYAVQWDPNGYRFYVDGALVWTENEADSISKRTEYMLLSSEVGDWVSGPVLSDYGTQATSTTKMMVDYVRVYVPEPTSLALLGTAVIGPLCGRRRHATA